MNCRDDNMCVFCKHWIGGEPNVCVICFQGHYVICDGRQSCKV